MGQSCACTGKKHVSALVQLPPSQSHPGSMVHELLHLRQGRREPRHFSQETENFEQSTGSPLFLSAPPTLPRAGTRPDTIPRFKIYIQVEYLHPNACSTPSRTPFPARTMQWPVNSCNAQTVTRLGKHGLLKVSKNTVHPSPSSVLPSSQASKEWRRKPTHITVVRDYTIRCHTTFGMQKLKEALSGLLAVAAPL